MQVVGDVSEVKEHVEGGALSLQRAHCVIPAIDAQVAHERHARRPIREWRQRAEQVHLAPLSVRAALVDCAESHLCVRVQNLPTSKYSYVPFYRTPVPATLLLKFTGFIIG